MLNFLMYMHFVKFYGFSQNLVLKLHCNSKKFKKPCTDTIGKSLHCV